MTRNLPAGAIYFGVFENTKNWFAARNESGVAKDWQIMFAGGFGGFLYWSLFYPVDVIKSAMMTDSINPAERQYKGFLDAAAGGSGARLPIFSTVLYWLIHEAWWIKFHALLASRP